MMHLLTCAQKPMNLVLDDTNMKDTTAICVQIQYEKLFEVMYINILTNNEQLGTCWVKFEFHAMWLLFWLIMSKQNTQ